MRGVERVADQDAATVAPACIAHEREAAPDRVIANERVAFEVVGEHTRAQRGGLRFAHTLEPGALERRLGHLDDERAHGRRVAIVMGVEVAEIVAPERLGERFERFRRPEPGEAVREIRDRRAERRFVGAPHQRIDAIRAYDEIGLAYLAQVGDRAAVARLDADRAGARLEQLQQLEPANRRKADAVDADAFAAMHHGDIGPRFEMRHDRRVGLRIVFVEKFERTVGKHHTEAEGGVGAVLLEHAHIGARVATFDKVCEVETGGPGAQDRNAHNADVTRPVRPTLRDHSVWLYSPTSLWVRSTASTALNISRMRASDAGLSTTTTSSGLLEEARTSPQVPSSTVTRTPLTVTRSRIFCPISFSPLSRAASKCFTTSATTAYLVSSGQCGAMVGDCQVRGSAFLRSAMLRPGLRSSMSHTASAEIRPSS